MYQFTPKTGRLDRHATNKICYSAGNVEERKVKRRLNAGIIMYTLFSFHVRNGVEMG